MLRLNRSNREDISLACGLIKKLSGSWNDRPVTRNLDPPFLIPPVPNISKYLDPPDNLFQFC